MSLLPDSTGPGSPVPPTRPLPSQVESVRLSPAPREGVQTFPVLSPPLYAVLRLRAALARGSQPAAPAGPRPGMRATTMPVSLLRARPEQGRLLGSNC